MSLAYLFFTGDRVRKKGSRAFDNFMTWGGCLMLSSVFVGLRVEVGGAREKDTCV